MSTHTWGQILANPLFYDSTFPQWIRAKAARQTTSIHLPYVVYRHSETRNNSLESSVMRVLSSPVPTGQSIAEVLGIVVQTRCLGDLKALGGERARRMAELKLEIQF